MTFKDYKFSNLLVRYIIDDTNAVSMILLPEGTEELVTNPWDKERTFDFRARYNRGWNMGHLAYYHIDSEPVSTPGGFTMKSENMAYRMKLAGQTLEKNGTATKIITTLKNEDGYKIIHTITHIEGLKGLECDTVFVNESDKEVALDMLTSFAMDNLSPFAEDDGPNRYHFHRFFGGWSLEGKHICQSVEEIGLEKTWAGFQNSSERFGSLGSYPVQRYFPVAAFEDRVSGVVWGAQLVHNATWQMELGHHADAFSFSGGLGDYTFCGWKKKLKTGESFKAPKAYLSAVKGDIFDACQALTDMHKPALKAYGEEGLPIAFNEYCTTWGKPTQEKMLSYCKNLKELGVKYAVIDAGWSKQGQNQEGNGEWPIDKSIFPDMKGMNKQIREMGMVPGVWFEFEVTTKGSKMFMPEYDYMHLSNNGHLVNNGGWRTYWDFRRKDVQDYLYEKVIKMLKDNDFGYIKVDYNGNTGPEADGADSGAEGLRQHLEQVRNFFKRMKEEIPDLIIENCASGGHRLEPSMMGVAALASFSDAHEAVEIPYIAANLHNLILPQQSLIWAVLHKDDSEKRLCYSLAATFLGRVCLSGEIDVLEDWQLKIVDKALNFYRLLDNTICNGLSKIYGNRGKNTRYPSGTQIVVRSTESEILVVCHAYENTGDEYRIEIPEGFSIASEFNNKSVSVSKNMLIVKKMEEWSAEAVLLRKN